MQRLFSTFANGWPGKGLLIQRALVGVLLGYCFVSNLGKTPNLYVVLMQVAAAGGGLLLLVGLWTPITGAVVAFFELWMVFLGPGDPRVALILAILAGTIAMIGPGAWSVDAQLFGRKHIEISKH
jgi:putative oxidoreductase